jgi:multiple antibiotic resistance protein
MSVAVTLGANATRSMSQGLDLVIASLIAPAAIALAIYLSYRWSARLESALGKSAMSVFLRLSSFILLCIGIQILWNGIRALLNTI